MRQQREARKNCIRCVVGLWEPGQPALECSSQTNIVETKATARSEQREDSFEADMVLSPEGQIWPRTM